MKKKLFIISTVLEIIFLLFSVCYFVFATEENLSAGAVENDLLSSLSGWTKKYSLTNPEITKSNIDTVLKDINTVLQRREMDGPVAEQHLSGALSMLLQPYNNTYCVKHFKGLSKTGGPILKGERLFNQINMNDYINFTPNDKTPTLKNSPTVFEDRCEAGASKKEITGSNYHIIKFWEGDLKSINNFYGLSSNLNPSNVIPYAIAFNETKTGHWALTNTQHAIWAVTGKICNGCSSHEGNLETTKVYLAGRAVDNYDTQVALHGQNPSISTGDNVGAVAINVSKDTFTYRVGPFKMSDYAFAYSENVKGYSGKDVSNYKGLIGGIDGMQITVTDDAGNKKLLNVDNNKVKIVYKDWYGKDTSQGERNRSTGAYTSKIPSAENIYPAPKSTFYIDIDKTEVPNNDATLETISISYRKTEVSGTGTVVIPRYAKTTLTLTDTGKQGCSRYVCPEDETHRLLYDSPGMVPCESSPNNTHMVVSKERGECDHRYKNCHVAQWTASSPEVGYGQPMLIAHQAECKVSSTPKDFHFGVRMTTEIKIKKYIKKVEHDTNGKVTFGDGINVGSALCAGSKPTDRALETDHFKQTYPIYAEYGDIITYQIDIVNEQKYEVKIKLKDILPKNIELIDMGGLKNNEWITVPKGDGKEFTVTKSFNVKVRTVANDDAEYKNEVKLLTQNGVSKNKDTNVDFIRTNSHNGPVVNMAEIQNVNNIMSKDYFKINDYNISIDKYLSKYNAEMMIANNNEGFTNESYELEDRANKEDIYKSTHPFPVEQSETFVYTIKLTNNSTRTTKKTNDTTGFEKEITGNKVATQVRPTTIKDTLEDGLEFVSLSGRIVKSDGTTRMSLKGSTYSIEKNKNKDNNQELNIMLADKQGKNYVILNPGETLIYEMIVKATKSNLYLYNLKNTASISVLTNINNGKDSKSENRVCRECDGSGKILSESKCVNCGSDGIVTSEHICPDCLGKGPCSQCGGTGKQTIRCNHEQEDFIYICSGCGWNTRYEFTVCENESCKGTNYYTQCAYCLGTPGVEGAYTINCTKCNGNKTAFGEKINCTNCNNTGKVFLEETCAHCQGIGNTINSKKCSGCNGTGATTGVLSSDRMVRSANGKVNRNTNTKEKASEYVKMKDLVISGKVWLDTNKDGTIGHNSNNVLQTGAKAIDVKLNNIPNYADIISEEYAMKGIKVKLYTADGTLVRTTETDSNGLYTFARKEQLTDDEEKNYYSGEYSYKDNKVIESEQRIPKATNKDANKNYAGNSKYISYYVEYEYDGVIYKSTEIYAGTTNLNEDDSMKEGQAYKYDSNACEFNKIREELNKNYEIISYNKATNGDLSSEQTLEYDKQNHNSYIKENTQRMITARSFVDVDKQTTKYLWLHSEVNKDKPETEYLKYINLGLEDRRGFDISLIQDVYEVKTIINGEEMTYEYNQNNSALGNAKLDKEQEKDNAGNETSYSKAFDSERFITGYQNDHGSVEDNRVLYNFEYYLEDYNYRVSQYHTETVRAYKGSNARNFSDNAANNANSVVLANSVGRESELNTQVTFRIKVTNNKQPDSIKNKEIFAGINEIVEYYDKDFVNLTFNGDGTLRGFNVKTKDSNGYLVNQEVKVVSAVAVMKDGSEKAVTLSNSSKYNTTRSLPNYDTLYITSAVENTYLNTVTNQGIKAGDLMLAEGESLDILITFVVEKQIDTDDVKEIETILGVKENVAEISAYSTYYKEGDNYKSASLIDKDSNPGNFGETYEGVSDVDSKEYIKYYEDDTFKTGINFKIPNTPPSGSDDEEKDKYKNNVQRTLTGFVWDDARTDEVKDDNGTQYVGDGVYDTSKNAIEEAKKNNSVSNKEQTDITVKDVKTQLVEIIRMPDPIDSSIERIYENIIKETRTASDGTYRFSGYVPGEYIVRFIYGDDVSKDNMLIFNGQDYKSTSYQTNESVYAENAIADGDKTASDKTLEILEHRSNSDAKDDEIRRLEVIGYSETMTNERNKVLRGINSTDKTALINNTYMEAATPEFLVRPEKEIKKVIKLKFIEHNKKITETITEARFAINNIDFGLQYRPELQVALNNYLSNITVTTSDESGVTQTPLVDAIFEPYYGIVKNTDTITGITSFVTDSNGEIIKVDPMSPNTVIENAITTAGGKIKDAQKNNDGTYVIALAGTLLNTDKSVGLMNLQYLPNEYIVDEDGRPKVELIEGKYVVKATQGFAYIVLDDSIMQGATIKVKYLLSGSNFSEIDRVSSNLSDLRFKENKETEKYAKVGGNLEQYYEEVVYQISADAEKPTFINQNYSAALTARNALFSEYYRYELEGNTIKKDLNGQNNVVYAVKHKDMPVDGKIIKIADITNPHKGNDGYYGRYLGSTYYTGAINKTMEVVAELKLDKIIDYIDNDLVFNDSDNKGKNGLWKTATSSELYQEKLITQDVFSKVDLTGKVIVDNSATFEHKILDSEGREYDTDVRSNLALSLDDRVRDDYAAGETDQTVNEEISQFLMPRYAKSLESYGTITITASKILSPEDKSDDMTYENIAEIIQYTSVTGRVTNLATTIGNAKIEEIGRNSNESPEFYEARTESDTASVEKITLTPPTGLGKINQAVRNVVESASYVVFVVIGVMLVCVMIAVSIHVYHRRRIK